MSDLGTADVVLRLLLDGQPQTRAELIDRSGLARSTVNGRIEALLASGLVVPSGEAASTGGRPPARFRFNPTARLVLAADVGATHLSVALTDLTGEILHRSTTQLRIDEGPEVVLDALVGAGHALLREAGRSPADLAGTGVGLPGPVEHSTGRPNHPPIMPGWDAYDVAGRLGRDLPGPVLVDNDVNIMALGEHATAYPQVEHLLFVKVATGIGAGVISGGRLHRGAQGAAGDIGHIQVLGRTELCRCGNSGCLETIASAAALASRLKVGTSKDIVELVRAGNTDAITAIRQAGREIGTVLAAAVSLLNPSVIVVGGSLAQAGDSLLAGLRETVYARSLPLATTHLHVVPSRTGRDAALLGAARLVCDQVVG
ncbi:ROK family transcriptional regulator [Kribbella solani]|uniref:ROK family transcriptional regulator n=1 Tax=Kribbella solani TaxID=236067 RepID=UPI0029B7DB1D|nr:ROK family transcriptional regulator [Kribbella solani]MDX2973241.1 ROK family transcriptional regulator [Kribbella solani]MDX3002324.1 ROK family transcriptional regulator [Kribbella solani]